MASRDMWQEMFTIQKQKPLRQKRAWLFGQWVPDGGAGGGAAGYGAPEVRLSFRFDVSRFFRWG